MSLQIRSSQLFKPKRSTIILQKKQPNRSAGTMIVKRPSAIEQPKSKKKLAVNYFQILDLKTLIKELKDRGGIERSKMLLLLDACQHKFKFQPNVLRVISPVMIVGDIHGQFFDLLNIFEQNGFPDKTKFLFLGDYVDRGLFCIEVMTLLMVLKIKHPDNLLLLRGNHEGRVMTMNFNFRLECQKKYGIQIYERFMQVFCKLPLCAVVDQTYFAVHGGISPEINKIKQIEQINRFMQISNHGVVCDLMWSDPAQDLNATDWQPNKMRGCSYYFGTSQAKTFLKTNKIKMIVRGHEVQIQGYNYQKTENDQKLTLTIFSAPNYCDVYKNKGAIAIVRDNKLAIHKFSEIQHPFVLSNYMNILEFSIPGLCQLVGKLFVYLLRNRRKAKKEALVNDNLLEELNAMRRIEQINQIIEKKLFENEFVLFEANQKQIEDQQDSQEAQNLNTSYRLSYQAFLEKKVTDEEEMYPHEDVLQTIRQRKRTKKMTLIIAKSTQQIIQFPEEHIKEVFGPKLNMKNNICKKLMNYNQEDQIGSEI